ncbi:MAG: DUF6268 family outer membrane beta-barrel protein [Bacteroidota bacterium]
MVHSLRQPKILSWLSLLCLLLFYRSVRAQIITDFFAEEVIGTLDAQTLQNPMGKNNKSRSRGIDIAYQGTGGVSFQEKDTPLDRPLPQLNHLGLLVLKLRIPVMLKDNFSLVVGTSYRPENYNVDNIPTDFVPEFTTMDQTTMKSTGFQVIANRTLNKNASLTFRLKTTYNGDFSGFVNIDHRYAIYSASGVYGVQKTKAIEWGVGLNINSSFRNRLVPLPIFLYNRTFNEKWGLELFLPASAKIRHNPRPNTIFLGGINFSSRNYRLDVERRFDNNELVNADYILRHSEIQMGVEIEQQIIPWLWLHARLGYQLNFRTTFDAKNEFANEFAIRPDNTPFFRLGIFVSPPDDRLGTRNK